MLVTDGLAQGFQLLEGALPVVVSLWLGYEFNSFICTGYLLHPTRDSLSVL